MTRSSCHQELVNIYTGQFADKSCNLDEAVKIGVEQYKKFTSSLPDGFYSTINHIVKPMIPKIKKNKKVEEVIIDAGLIYSRAMVLMQNKSEQSPELTMENILSYELCGVPFSLFKVDGSMRIPKNKSQLKNKLKVEVNCRVNSPKVRIIDGSAVLWTISWPGKGAVVTDFLSNGLSPRPPKKF